MVRVANLRRRLAREESGFTLIELMTAIAIGTVIVLAAFGLLDASVKAFKKTDDRVDVTQRGRLAMDFMGQKLRSQVCGALADGTSTAPIAQATATSVSFWVDTSAERSSSATGINANKKLVGFSFSGNNLYALSYAGTDITTTLTQKLQLQSVVPNFSSTVAFRYYEYNPSYDSSATSGSTSNLFTELTSPVAASDLDQIVRVDVNYKAFPLGGLSTSKDSVVFQNQFNAQTADAFDQSPPDC
jgi:prepilin-type N-terminal cleavage/methylation domain-containing protein